MAKTTKWLEAKLDEPVSIVAERALRSRLAAWQNFLHLGACHAGEDIEHVHQLRTWSRRTRVATQVFQQFLPARRTAWLNKQLRRVRWATNDARDDDVFVTRLAADASRAEAAQLLMRVRRHRAEGQPPIVAVYRRLTNKDRLVQRVAKMLPRIRWRGAEGEPEPAQFGDWATRQMRAAVVSFFAAAELDLTSIEALHQFRIGGKKLRYTMELAGGALPECVRTEIYPLVSALQEKLGELNDLTTAQARLTRWLEASKDAADAAYLQDLLSESQRSWEQRHNAFFVWWTKDWQQELRARFDCALGDIQPQASCA